MRNALIRLFAVTRFFWRWWLAELAGMVPAGLKRGIARRRERLVLAVEADGLVLSHELGGKSRLLGRAATARLAALPDGEAAALLLPERSLRQRLRRGRLPLCLRLPAAWALRPRLVLPLGVESNLGEVLQFELDRRTPFSPEEVYFAHRIAGRDAEAGRLEVELTVVRRQQAEAAMASAARLGLAASAVAVAAASPAEAESGDLLPESGRRAAARLPRRLARAAAMLLLLLGAVALYRPIHAARQAATELRAEVTLAKRAADRAVHVKQAIARLSEGERYLVERKRARPSVTEILCDLTRALPDDTWLTRVNIEVDAVRLEGYSDASSALIERLGQSALLNEPRFPAAVTQDPATGKERFQLAAKVARKGGS